MPSSMNFGAISKTSTWLWESSSFAEGNNSNSSIHFIEQEVTTRNNRPDAYLHFVLWLTREERFTPMADRACSTLAQSNSQVGAP